MTSDIPFNPCGKFHIISGGQTGADRAALDFALARGIKHGGWCPKGRKAEDGILPPRYRLLETPSASYLVRTERNVSDSDATIVFTIGKLGRGSKRTLDFARKLHRPYLHIALGRMEAVQAADLMEKFIRSGKFKRVNVAGSRESKEPGIYRLVMDLMGRVFDPLPKSH